jgi:hypothetical protein
VHERVARRAIGNQDQGFGCCRAWPVPHSERCGIHPDASPSCKQCGPGACRPARRAQIALYFIRGPPRRAALSVRQISFETGSIRDQPDSDARTDCGRIASRRHPPAMPP